jgi:hypothetical protein
VLEILPRQESRFFVFVSQQGTVEAGSEVLAGTIVEPNLRQEMAVDSNWLWEEVRSALQLVGQPRVSLVEVLQSHSRVTWARRQDSLDLLLDPLGCQRQRGSHCRPSVVRIRSSLYFLVIGLVGVPFRSVEQVLSAVWQSAH